MAHWNTQKYIKIHHNVYCDVPLRLIINPIRAKPYFQATFEFWFLGLSNR